MCVLSDCLCEKEVDLVPDQVNDPPAHPVPCSGNNDNEIIDILQKSPVRMINYHYPLNENKRNFSAYFYINTVMESKIIASDLFGIKQLQLEVVTDIITVKVIGYGPGQKFGYQSSKNSAMH